VRAVGNGHNSERAFKQGMQGASLPGNLPPAAEVPEILPRSRQSQLPGVNRERLPLAGEAQGVPGFSLPVSCPARRAARRRRSPGAAARGEEAHRLLLGQFQGSSLFPELPEGQRQAFPERQQLREGERRAGGDCFAPRRGELAADCQKPPPSPALKPSHSPQRSPRLPVRGTAATVTLRLARA